MFHSFKRPAGKAGPPAQLPAGEVVLYLVLMPIDGVLIKRLAQPTGQFKTK